jgi:hypothetical protein
LRAQMAIPKPAAIRLNLYMRHKTLDHFFVGVAASWRAVSTALRAILAAVYKSIARKGERLIALRADASDTLVRHDLVSLTRNRLCWRARGSTLLRAFILA